MRSFMKITKALADESRVRVLLALRTGELCVCQITELFGFAPSTMSKHLAILFEAGLVESRKEGRWMYYRLPGADASAQARQALRWVEGSLSGVAEIRRDVERMKRILREDPADLCKKQTQK